MPSSTDAATLSAIQQGQDETRREYERRWGMGRLEAMASDELRAKFLRQGVRYTEAATEAWASPMLTIDQLAAVEKHAAAMKRAWQALEDAASEAGYRPQPPTVWEVRMADGRVAALVQDDADASLASQDCPGRWAAVWTLTEVAHVIQSADFVSQIKGIWPEAKVQEPRRPKPEWVKGGDEIPFGADPEEDEWGAAA